MTKALLLLLSASLIASGVLIIWRDVARRRRAAFLVRADATALHGEAEVMVARSDPDAPFPLPRIAPNPLLEAGGGPDVGPSAGGDPSRASEPPAQWAALRPVLDDAVEKLNSVLAGAGVTIGAAGEPSWSMMKKGYGVHRRVLLNDESMAWLRLELASGGRVQASVKAHKDDLSAINATASAAVAGLRVTRATELLAECLKLAAAYAVRSASGGGDGAGSSSAANSHPGMSAEQWASGVDWKAIDTLVAAALRAANGALGDAGARFLPLGAPAWVPDVQRHRLAVKVEVLGVDAARLHVERIAQEIEVSVGLADPRLASLGRRGRLPLVGLTTHALAEVIASSAWPAIAYVREGQSAG
jgi:hypothetical protein